MNIDKINMSEVEFSGTHGAFLDSSVAWRYRVFPAKIRQEEFLMTDQLPSQEMKTELEFLLETPVELMQIDTPSLERLLAKQFRKSKQSLGGKSLKELTEADFIEKLVDECNQLGVSDVHLEPGDNLCRIRYRIDGKLISKYSLEVKDYKGVVNRVKVRAGLDIAEKRLPQDGRIQLFLAEERVDVRVNSTPTLYGEKLVLRILLQSEDRLNVERLGMSSSQEAVFLRTLKQQSGIILISGPTGSGKTTTLYSALKLMNEVSQNICTVEDPIEYRLEGINQVQVKESIGLTFSEALRALLRQDPDVIMIGEIRDLETAQMAIRASLTGHLVLSTIHTNSALDTINRLIDMGVPKFLLAPTIKLSIAQRLIRKLCEHCRTSDTDGNLTYSVSSQGCEHCYYTGYRGRIAIYEMIPTSKSFRTWVTQNANPDDYPERVVRLADRASELVSAGITSLDEIYSITE